MRRLVQNGINYIIHAKNRGKSTKDISLEMKVCGRWVQKIYKRYLDTGEIPVLGTSGRPKKEITDRMRQTVADCFGEYRLGPWVVLDPCL